MSLAAPRRMLVKAADGQQFGVYQKGDEFLNWFEDTSGNPMIRDETGQLAYAQWNDEKKVYEKVESFTKSSRKKYLKRTLNKASSEDVTSKLAEGRRTRHRLFNQTDLMWMTRTSSDESESEPQPGPQAGLVRSKCDVARAAQLSVPKKALAPNSIKRPVLAIHVLYSDTNAATAIADSYISQMIHAKSSFGSVAHYYDAHSEGAVEIVNLGLKTVTLSTIGKSYGSDFYTFRDEVVVEAMKLLVAAGWDPSPYSIGTSYISGLSTSATDLYEVIDCTSCLPLLIIEGGEASYDSSTPVNVWGHAWGGVWVASGTKKYYFANYTAFGAWHGTHEFTSGIIVHECGHAMFGFPDLYDTDSDKNQNNDIPGIGLWSTMAAGEWGTIALDGDCPGNLDAYCISLINPGLLKDIPLSTASGQQTIDNPYRPHAIEGSGNEKFLLQVRDFTGYDAGLMSLMSWGELSLKSLPFTPGVLIEQTDPSYTDSVDGASNLMPVRVKEAHGGTMDLQTKGNAWSTPSKNGAPDDLFGSLTQDEFGETTDPDNKLSTGSFPGFELTAITTTGSSATYNFASGQNVPTPPAPAIPPCECECDRPRMYRLRAAASYATSI